MRLTLTALALVSFAAPALAQDVEAGAKAFNQCQTCHVVQNEAGETLAGKNAKTGPNLYAVVGRVAGSLEGFKYGAGIEELHAAGYVWTEADIATYVQDPTAFLVEKTGDKKAKSKMMFKLKKPEDAANVAAYLVSLAPAAAAPADGAAAPADGTAAPATN
jgi:cytochrome c